MTQPKSSNFAWQDRDLIAKWKSALDIIDSKGQSVFTELFDYVDPQQGPLNGAIVSIKDLFQVQGYKTQAGSVFINQQLAKQDAAAVALLRAAGASFLGHTNMTELAYSGLGLNPHYGTPDNPIKAGRITGGSTSGGAASIALGIADAALGTDTGGSLRIPAAFCGLTGFKPSQQTVSRKGCLPLSDSLDSVGPIAKTVEECELLWRVLSGVASSADTTKSTDSSPLSQLKIVVPSNFGMNDLDALVEEGFAEKLAQLEAAGVVVERRFIDALEVYKTLPVWQFSAFESQAFYSQDYDLEKADIDPRVASRLARAKTINAEDFQQTQAARKAFIKQVSEAEPNTVFLLPTVAVAAPKLSDLEKDSEYDRLNLLCLRNTSLANVLDGCSISLPFNFQQEPMGLMLTAGNGMDQALFDLAKQLEPIVRG
ncbi:aspartyl-tRNA(Asn)/glutamyl-tRNA(Gln) amidotransferase subunit A [Marinomonas polaris DSM 16579]|uniref:Aspartyl-tRNA(Asn)/glutamyl-tRNA(Gln) amidotransferase subunit A n=1 Tax=Marinomonas polaris DSM 16579 TaxID=1122206 RepID=A0A1M4WIF6_9GAMM|nr:amidase family protein [Marinomonas polaris]SHE81071.1 aspartyl-tRNA(Asn)/glutamyl-tRNA(Gln) amidotransferase subunit A [Marinomonas polaris DSM 16579]